jgi:hypothetical protein
VELAVIQVEQVVDQAVVAQIQRPAVLHCKLPAPVEVLAVLERLVPVAHLVVLVAEPVAQVLMEKAIT